jgi:hypothetical protein
MQHGAEHFLDGLWLDNADLHFVPPRVERRELAGATELEPTASCPEECWLVPTFPIPGFPGK